MTVDTCVFSLKVEETLCILSLNAREVNFYNCKALIFNIDL